MINHMQQKGFTLIELLVVIAIIAILSVVVILALNPAQLLAQARDSQRISDMATIKSAISLYLADQSSPSIGSANTCYASALTIVSSTCIARMAAADTAIATATAASSTQVGGGPGNGWIPINFTGISSGAPIGSLPVDPVNNLTYYYSYATNASPSFQFELDAHMESTKYAGGSSDVEGTDGGSSSTIYETGTKLTL
jgi:prepilin-type N-terminal cleavage/methylation domain-containing protein